MKFDIITVGSGVVDAFMETALPEKKKSVLLPVGSKVVCNDLWFSSGGGGTNTAVAFSRLGMKTGYVGRLGNDEHGALILNELKRNNVTFLGQKGTEPTGFSVVVDSVKLNRTILTYKGANSYLKFSEINLKHLNTSWFYFSAMIDGSLRTQERLAAWARKRNIRIAYNPSSYLTRQGIGKLRKILRHVEVLILNYEEARHLVRSGDVTTGLRKFGPRIVCVTDGERGASICDGIHLYQSKPRKVRIVEKTGAGDAFASGFVSGLILYNDLEHAIEVGSLNAEGVIQKAGAKNGLLTKRELQRKMKQWPIRIVKRKL